MKTHATPEDVLPDEVKRLGFAPDHLATALDHERGARALCGAGLHVAIEPTQRKSADKRIPKMKISVPAIAALVLEAAALAGCPTTGQIALDASNFSVTDR